MLPLSPTARLHDLPCSCVAQTVVERFNYEINMRVLVPFRRLIDCMEYHGLLSKEDEALVYAFSVIAQPLCQHGLDLLVTLLD